MANPVVTAVPKDAWLKVATNVITGSINILKTDAKYRQTYRTTGGTGPTDKDEGASIVGLTEVISSVEAIDVYVYTEVADGIIRVNV